MPPRKKTTKVKKKIIKAEQVPLPELGVQESAEPVEADAKTIETVETDESPAFSELDEKNASGQEKYFEAIGRRKSSVARVRLYTKKSTDTARENGALMTINGKEYADYLLDANLISRVEAPLKKLKSLNRFKATIVVHGGGVAGQADAIRHGIARTLEKFDTNFRKKLKKSGFLTRDAREKERRKYGKKRKARKSPQWSKR